MTRRRGCWERAVLLVSISALLPRHTLGLESVQQPATEPQWLEQLSWKPRAYLYHSFMSAEEADHLVELARPTVARSEVVDPETGGSVLDSVRTSHGTFLTRYQDDIVRNIEDRLAAWTQLPVENGEDLQILRYEHGQKYDEHWDWFDPEELEKMNMTDGNRIATVLMYLSDVEAGGETSFSQSVWLNKQVQAKGSPSECAMNKVFVAPKKGDALLFWDLKPDGQTGDKYSMHAGCPVIRGEKWSATKWIHSTVYGDDWDVKEQRMEERAAKLECKDDNDKCQEWADSGQCQSKRWYMMGDAATGRLGACRKACGVCIVCQPGDLLCERKSLRLQRKIEQAENGEADEHLLDS